MKHEIFNIKLANEGRKAIEWANSNMPVLNIIQKQLEKEKPFKDTKIGVSLCITPETANLVNSLQKGGAEVYLCASNSSSTNNSVAASLVKHYKIATFAIQTNNQSIFHKHQNAILEMKPDLIIDDGGDLTTKIHTKIESTNYSNEFESLIGITEQTTSGVITATALEKSNQLRFPIIAVNDNMTKNMFDNRYGTGQSTIDAIIRNTNILLSGKTFVVCGYGWCGKGISQKAKGMGANVIITEIDPIKALEAHMNGFQVMPLYEAIKKADIVVSVTGNINIVSEKHFKNAKEGVILAQSGHENVEIDISTLKKMSSKIKEVKPFVKEFIVNGKKLYLLSDGNILNLSAADGNPASVMDLSFAGQVYALKYLLKNKGTLKPIVNNLPHELDKELAQLKIESLNLEIDKLTGQQKQYLHLHKVAL